MAALDPRVLSAALQRLEEELHDRIGTDDIRALQALLDEVNALRAADSQAAYTLRQVVDRAIAEVGA